MICFVGICITWPTLMAIHATGTGGLSQLDRITIGNVQNSQMLFAHAIIAWVFFGRCSLSRMNSNMANTPFRIYSLHNLP